MQLIHVNGAGRTGPLLFGANSEVTITPRCPCAELIALCCAVCLLMSRSERQYVSIYGVGGARGPREDNQAKKATRQVHNTYIILVPVSYLVLLLLLLLLLYVQKNAQRRTTQHRKTKGRARHRTALRCAAELYIAGLT